MNTDTHRWTAYLAAGLAPRVATTLFVLATLVCACTTGGPNRPAGTLFDAVKGGDLEQTRLRTKWMDYDARRREGWPALNMAASMGELQIAKVLIEAGVPVDLGKRRISTPLHFAAGKNRVEIMQLLIDHDARIDAIDRFDKNPLHWAADSGSLEAAKLLLEHDADPDARSEFGTPAQAAKANHHQMVYDLLIQQGKAE